MNFRFILLASLFCFAIPSLEAQDKPATPTLIGTGVFMGKTLPLKDLPAISPEEYQIMKEKADKKLLNKKLRVRSYPFSESALPKGADEVWQKTMGKSAGLKAPIVNFSGQTSPYYPPDCNGAVGPNHFMQTINSTYAIYNKSGTLVAGPTAMNLLFGSVTGSGCNDGDPLILYDEQASRWLAVEFSICGANDYMLIAVSTTNDPTGTWNKYSFDVADTPDYEKFGIWQDGYYMGDNNSASNDIYVFQRSVMLAGGASPGMVAFNNPYRPTSIDGFMCVPPVDNDGAFAPTGAPGIFIAFNDDAIAGGSDQLWIYELSVNWTTPASSTFNRVQQLAVTAFDSNFGNDWTNIAQPGTTQQLDAIPQVIMNIPQYRNFGTYQTIVCCHTVDVDATDHAGVRWYELRRGTQTSGNWAIRQQGTYAPDAHSRWMGSVSLNGSGKIGLGYSISSSTIYPGIRYTGQSASAYSAANGTMDIPEGVIQTGSYSQTGVERWGDYSAISVDPTDDQTFWFTTEYINSSGSRVSKVASFKFGNNPAATTLAASAITSSSATLNGMVNPNGLATTYYFEYGTTTGYGTPTTTVSAGSGTDNVTVNANISGLTAGILIHFRLVAINSDGTTYGSDMAFTPGGATVSTTAATSITTNSATSGGNVSADGGSAVTARGVCWATTTNPVATGNHTTDGSGLGTFTSYITGLTPSTTFHVRAYATNANGTYYGNDITFTTPCGVISSFPWNQGFENAGVIPSCWTNEQVSSSGINWTFVTGNGASNPATAHTGTYNACLKDNNIADNKTRLITPQINLTGVSSPTLTFWHTQAVSGTRQDQLEVYYKTSAAGTWTLLASYTTSVTTWTQRSISLPNGSSDYYIAFQGNAKRGFGVCIDDVQIACTASPVSVTISASSNPVCAGTSVTFTATPTNGGTTPSYQWKVNGTNVGTNNASYSYTPVNNDAITCVLTSNASCVSGNPATSGSVTMTVSPVLPVSVSITPSVNPVCAGTSVTFTPIPVNGGTPSYQWFKNTAAVGTGPSYSYVPANGDQVYVTMTSSLTCKSGSPATSGAVTMTVNPLLPASVSISPSANNLCANTPVTFTATPTNGGTTPAYQWKVNGNNAGTNSATFTYAPSNADAVTCVLTSNASCVSGSPANSDPVTMTVNPLLPASVSISPSANNICANTPVTFTATPTNGGTTPAYQWKVNGNNAGTNSATFTYAPANADAVICVLTSNASCVSGSPANSGPVTMTVNPLLPASVSISPSANNICANTPVTFTATPTNGGTTPAYQWKVNGNNAGTNSATLTYAPENADAVTCVLTSDETCSTGSPANSSELTMTVNPLLTVSISIAPSANPVVSGTSVTFTATPFNGGTTPAFQWNVNSMDVGIYSSTFTYFPSNNDAINCILTSNATCATGNPATSDVVTMTVDALQLSVTPLDQIVSDQSGISSFSVTSNTNWSVISDQSWCLVNPSGTGNGTITATYAQNVSTTERKANITTIALGLSPVLVTLTQQGIPVKQLNLNVMLEGLFNGVSMNKSKNALGDQFADPVADQITVELHEAVSPYVLAGGPYTVNVNTDGSASVTVPASLGSSYYIVVKHRNSLETWNTSPLSFSGATMSYNFSSSANKAYGNNMKLVSGKYVIFGGDVNQDGIVDSGDIIAVDNDASNFINGYLTNDVNGDGTVNSDDLMILRANASVFVVKIMP